MKKRFLITSLVALLLTFTNVYAEDITTTGLEEQKATVTDQVFYADDEIEIKEEAAASTFVAGNNVTVNNKSNGISFSAGNNVTNKGTSDYAFVAGNNVSFTGSIEKDLFLAGNNVNIGTSANIGRDVYIAGNTIKINSNITGSLRAAGTSLDLSGITVSGKVVAAVSEIIMDENTIIEGKLVYFEDTVVKGLEEAKINEKEIRASDAKDITISFGASIYERLLSAIAGFIVMVVLFYMMPKTKKRIDDVKIDNVKNVMGFLGKGILVLIVIPFISIVTLVTGILMPLALIVLALYVIGIYLASLFASYIIGKELTQKVLKNDNQYLALGIGILLVKLVTMIPLVGGVIGAICLFYGLGLEYELIKR